MDYETYEPIIDFSAMCAEELADYCLELYELIAETKSKLQKRELIINYNLAALYYNENVAKFNCLKLC